VQPAAETKIAEVFMRKALLVLAICIVAAPAWAGGGLSLFGSYAQLSEESEAVGFGARLSFGSDRWVGDLSWTWYPSEDSTSAVAGYEDSLQVIPLDLGVRHFFNSSGSFAPYVGAGGTFFYTNLDSGSIDKAYGLYGVLGFNLGRGSLKFFAEGIYRWGETDVSYFVGEQVVASAGLDLGGYGANAGIVFSF
jgi:hypothetical protein